MPSFFAARPLSQLGESLSSWRQRVGWCNGYRLFPIEAGRLRRVDPDTCIDVAELGWIAKRHGVSFDELLPMTLRGILGGIGAIVTSRHHVAWWLRPKYGVSKHASGSMFCPTCLATKPAYFRLDWRLGFNTVCPHHGTLYLGECPGCGALPWPAGCGNVRQLHDSFDTFARCWQCGVDLSAIECARNGLNDPLAPLWEDSTLACFSHMEVLGAVRALAHLFLRTSPRRLLLNSPSPQLRVARHIEDTGSARAIEEVPIETRFLLLQAAAELLQEWPKRFCEFADQHGLSRVHFSGSYHLHPKWFEDVVNGALAKQNRWVQMNDVVSTAKAIRNEGRRVTKAEIRKRLGGWQGVIPTHWWKFA